MGNYDIERENRKSEEIRAAFREMFPLENEDDLPWAACQIKAFLRDRIEREVAEGVFHFQSRVVRVLCEVSPPKTHVEDMCRIVVEAKRSDDLAKRVDALANEKQRRVYYQDIMYELCSMIDRVRGDGQKTVCGTLETPSRDVQESLLRVFDKLAPKP